MKNKLYIFILLAFLFSCKTEPKDEDAATTEKIAPPPFNADSAYHYIAKQVAFGPRVSGTPQHTLFVNWVTEKFKAFADTVIIQQGTVTTFDNKNIPIKNIIASFNPASKNRILLCAHYDTRPFADQDFKDQDKPILGANDGGSGVGVLLEIARQLKLKKPQIGIDIILFDAEDYGQPENSNFPQKEDTYCLGSQYWANNKHVANYTAQYGILLDMVGASNATFTQEGNSVHYASHVVKNVWGKAASLGHSSHFIYEKTSPITDDHYYINKLAGIPTIDIIQYDPATPSHFTASWHTHNDDMNVIDRATLKAVGETVLAVIYTE